MEKHKERARTSVNLVSMSAQSLKLPTHPVILAQLFSPTALLFLILAQHCSSQLDAFPGLPPRGLSCPMRVLSTVKTVCSALIACEGSVPPHFWLKPVLMVLPLPLQFSPAPVAPPQTEGSAQGLDKATCFLTVSRPLLWHCWTKHPSLWSPSYPPSSFSATLYLPQELFLTFLNGVGTFFTVLVSPSPFWSSG